MNYERIFRRTVKSLLRQLEHHSSHARYVETIARIQCLAAHPGSELHFVVGKSMRNRKLLEVLLACLRIRAAMALQEELYESSDYETLSTASQSQDSQNSE